MANLPVDATAFAVFEMQELSAESFDSALEAAGDELAVVFFWGLDCFNCEIAKKAMLVLLNQPVEQVRISPPKSTSNLSALLRHRAFEIQYSRVHTTDTYATRARKDASLLRSTCDGGSLPF